MAFDGFVISNIVNELNEKILNGRIYKIYQPEADEITKSHPGPQFLYAFEKASEQWPDHFCRTAGL